MNCKIFCKIIFSCDNSSLIHQIRLNTLSLICKKIDSLLFKKYHRKETEISVKSNFAYFILLFEVIKLSLYNLDVK